jgi:hypothetical protein
MCVGLRCDALQNLEHLRAGNWLAATRGENEAALTEAGVEPFFQHLPGMVLHRDEFPDPPAFDEHVLKSAAGVLLPFQSEQLRDAEPRS